MPKVKDVIDHLRELDPDSHIASPIWCEEDVIGYAKNEMEGIELSTEQAREILDELERKHDCELGISWLTIRWVIQETTG